MAHHLCHWSLSEYNHKLLKDSVIDVKNAEFPRQILEQAIDTYPELNTIRVHIAQDCTGKIKLPQLNTYRYNLLKTNQHLISVYLDDVLQSSSKDKFDEPDYEIIDNQWKSLILLIPLRLGGERMNPSYDSCLKGLLSLEQCIGIIGGKPKHSRYFIGWQGELSDPFFDRFQSLN